MTQAALDERCSQLLTISARIETTSAAQLEVELAGTWYACGGTSAMSDLFRVAPLGKTRGFVANGMQGWPLEINGGAAHPVFCLECSFPIKYVDGSHAAFSGDEIEVGFIGQDLGIAVARSESPTTVSLFARVDY